MRIRSLGTPPEKIQLQMTPMIDVVFQLLVFFIMSFRIVLPEGDFNIKMPRNTPSEAVPDPNQLPPIKVHLTSDDQGQLTDIRLNDTSFGTDYDRLQDHIISFLGPDRGPGSISETAEVELEADFQLHYEYTAEAISRISGYLQNGRVIKLIEKIRFTPLAPDETP
jgi:biopolymer transport protein ExbD